MSTQDAAPRVDPTDERTGWRALVGGATLEIDGDGRIGSVEAGDGPFAALAAREGTLFATLLRASERVAWLHALDGARRGTPRSLRLALCAAPDGRSWLDATVRLAPGDERTLVALDAASENERSAPDTASGLAELAHELRTPLNAVRGYAQALDADLFGALGPRQREAVRGIVGAADHLIEVANTVLDGARLGTGGALAPVEADPSEAVARACAMLAGLADRAGVTVAHRPGASAAVRHDPAALRQIVLNLVSNAIKASPRGAVVGVDLCSSEAGEADPGAASIEIAVRDVGPGIPDDVAAGAGAAWERGIAAEGEATGGVGLPLVRRLCALQGGTLRFEARAGGGTVATVRLPVAAAAPAVAPIHASEPRETACLGANGAAEADTADGADERIRRFEAAFPCRLVG